MEYTGTSKFGQYMKERKKARWEKKLQRWGHFFDQRMNELETTLIFIAICGGVSLFIRNLFFIQ